MTRRKLRTGLAIAAALALAAGAAPLVQAVTSDTGDAVAVNVAANLKANTNLTLNATIGGASVTLTCTKASTGFTLASTGKLLGPFNLTLPAFTGCTDNFLGTDTVHSNATNGAWMATFVDAPNDAAGEVPGDRISISIPKAGQTITSSAVANCTITVAPAARVPASGAYDDKGTLTFTNAPLPFATSAGCPGGAATGTGKLSTALKPSATGTPGFAVTPPIRDIG